MTPAWFTLDLLLAALATLRLTRLATTDTISHWLIHEPLEHHGNNTNRTWPWWTLALIECPHCIGFWLSVLAVGSLAIAGGPGDADSWWRYGAGALALSYLVGHTSQRLDRGDDADQ